MHDKTPHLAADVVRAVWSGDVAKARRCAVRIVAKSALWEHEGAGLLLDAAPTLPSGMGPVTAIVGEQGGGAEELMHALVRLGPYGMVVVGGQDRMRQCIGAHMALARADDLLDYYATHRRLPDAVLRLVGPERAATEAACEAIARSPGMWAAYAAVEALHGLAALRLPKPPVLLLPDLGTYLHPTVQINLARELFHRAPGSVQIIATTQSPYVVDYAEPGCVLAFARDAKGNARCKLLSEHPDAPRWGWHSGTSGQLWSMDMEHQWVLA